jgi:hypothetical protein
VIIDDDGPRAYLGPLTIDDKGASVSGLDGWYLWLSGDVNLDRGSLASPTYANSFGIQNSSQNRENADLSALINGTWYQKMLAAHVSPYEIRPQAPGMLPLLTLDPGIYVIRDFGPASLTVGVSFPGTVPIVGGSNYIGVLANRPGIPGNPPFTDAILQWSNYEPSANGPVVPWVMLQFDSRYAPSWLQ